MIFTFLLNPIFWIDLSFFIETIKINVGHFNNVGTNTFGKIMYSKDLTFYLFANLVSCKNSINNYCWDIIDYLFQKKKFLKIKKDQFIMELY